MKNRKVTDITTSPPAVVALDYAVPIGGTWRSFGTARDARTAAWDARGGIGGQPPPVWRRHPDRGWVTLMPGPPKSSGPSGRSLKPLLRLALSEDDLVACEIAADGAGLTVQAWARRVLRSALRPGERRS